MKIAVLSYSLSGNNRKLAEKVSKDLPGTYLRVNESTDRDMKKIAMDMLFGRLPKVAPKPEILEVYNFVLIISPVWMGKVASPIRPFLPYIKDKKLPYAFVTISGGANGQSEKLTKELEKKTGKRPKFVLDIKLSDIVPRSQIDQKQIKMTDKMLEEVVIKIKSNVSEALGGSD